MLDSRSLGFLSPTSPKPDLPLFVFLPGLDGTGQLLRSQTSGLERQFEIRCLALPSDQLTHWQDLAQQVVDLLAVEQMQHPDRSIFLCGESFGGCLAMQVATIAPALVQRLILINPASSFARRPWMTWSTQLSRVFPGALYQMSTFAFLPLLASLGRIAEADRQMLTEIIRSIPQATSLWRMAMLADFRVPAQALQQLSQPTLILASGKDRLLPSVSEAYRLKALLQNATVGILPDSGHACLLEAGVNLADLLLHHGFLADSVIDTSKPPMQRSHQGVPEKVVK